MEPLNINKLTQQLKQILSEEILNKLGKQTRFCKREREISPFRLTLGLVEAFACKKIETLADLQRAFNSTCDTSVCYKPFYNQLAKPEFPQFMRKLCERLMNTFVDKSLEFPKSNPFSRFSRIVVHDGSSFGIKSSLKEVFPGRFTTTKPAAVELHVTMELLSESIESIVLAPDTESEVHFAPEPESIKGGLLLADRMFFIKDYLARIEQAQGHYIVRSKGVINPNIISATRPDGSHIKRWRAQSLKDVKKNIKRYDYVDLKVQWGRTLTARVIASWDHKNNRPRFLVTNLAQCEFSAQQVMDAYRLRWQVELMFKELKSYANLHAFDTNNEAIAEGLIWTALVTVLLKRLMALKTQQIKQIPISTRTVAMAIGNQFANVIRELIHSPKKLKQAMTKLVDYLASQAKRAHPERDKQSGRQKLGLQLSFECP